MQFKTNQEDQISRMVIFVLRLKNGVAFLKQINCLDAEQLFQKRFLPSLNKLLIMHIVIFE